MRCNFRIARASSKFRLEARRICAHLQPTPIYLRTRRNTLFGRLTLEHHFSMFRFMPLMRVMKMSREGPNQ